VVDKPGKLDMLRGMGADHAVDYLTDDFTRSGKTYDLILDVKTNRSPLAYVRALRRGGTYATVGGSTTRLLQIVAIGKALSRASGRHLRVVGLKPNKDLAYVNELFEAGKLTPVVDRTYALAHVPDALRRFATGDHMGKIIIRIA
jgi:NADPH:quinone reductase-like Zn-dependent oxidoreductase